jgi:hypothetical protein
MGFDLERIFADLKRHETRSGLQRANRKIR